MAPKRKRKVVGVVKTTKKVIRETVRVAVVDNDDDDNNDTQPSQISLPDFEGETEELRESQQPFMGMTETEEEEGLPFEGDIATNAPPSSSTRRTSTRTRRTIVVEDMMPEGARTKCQVPINVPTEGGKEDVSVRTDERKEDNPSEEITEEMAPDPETQGGRGGGAVKDVQAREKVESKEKPKAEKADGGGKKASQRRSKRRKTEDVGNEEYRRYVYKVLKTLHPGMRISGQAMTVLNAYMNDMFERLANEAAKLSKYTGRLTLSSREIQGAVKLVLPGELGRHAIAEGAKAVSNYMAHETNYN